MTIFERTTNLVELYGYICGESEVPKEFNKWAFMSLLASRVEDRVWLEKDIDEKMSPKLYVFLIGPSRLGKGSAIGKVLRLGAEVDEMSGREVKCYNGDVTAKH